MLSWRLNCGLVNMDCQNYGQLSSCVLLTMFHWNSAKEKGRKKNIFLNIHCLFQNQMTVWTQTTCYLKNGCISRACQLQRLRLCMDYINLCILYETNRQFCVCVNGNIHYWVLGIFSFGQSLDRLCICKFLLCCNGSWR